VRVGVVPQQTFAVFEPVGLAIDFEDRCDPAIGGARHRQHQMKSQDAAERAAMFRHVLAWRKIGKHRRDHLR
jgi:hypothetical protein